MLLTLSFTRNFFSQSCMVLLEKGYCFGNFFSTELYFVDNSGAQPTCGVDAGIWTRATMAGGERSPKHAIPCSPRGYLPTTEAFFTFQLSLKIIVFLNCRDKMKYKRDYFTDRIVHLQRNDFAFLKYVIYCCRVYADLAVIKYTTSWQHEKTAKLWWFIGKIMILSIFLGLFARRNKNCNLQ